MKRLFSLLVLCASLPAAALEPDAVAQNRRTVLERYLTAAEAHRMVDANPAGTLFIDVRTPAEVSYVGIPAGMDANIPFLLIDFDYFDPKTRSTGIRISCGRSRRGSRPRAWSATPT